MASESEEFRVWLETLLLKEGDEAVRSSAPEPERAAEETATLPDIRELILSLLKQWREQGEKGDNPISALRTQSGHLISKTEQRFLQRVTDMVITANDRCNQAIQICNQTRQRERSLQVTLEINSRRLKNCIKHLHRYRRRALAFEKGSVVSIDRCPSLPFIC